MRPYDPATQQRAIGQRLHALDLINERFARSFRTALFSLMRRSIDVSASQVSYLSARDFNQEVEGKRMTFNLFSMKPLRGNAMMSLSANFVFMAVENLFGGSGRITDQSKDRDFSMTEMRIIQRVIQLALEAYKTSWKSVFPIEPEFVRAETESKFTNLTNSQTDLLINTKFAVDLGNFNSTFQISIPYSMVEPIKSQLVNMANDHYSEDPEKWKHRVSSEIKGSQIELFSDFTYIDTTISELISLKVGDVLPISLPTEVTANIDGVPVMVCDYGNRNGHHAIVVKKLINHALLNIKPSPGFIKAVSKEARKI